MPKKRSFGEVVANLNERSIFWKFCNFADVLANRYLC